MEHACPCTKGGRPLWCFAYMHEASEGIARTMAQPFGDWWFGKMYAPQSWTCEVNGRMSGRLLVIPVSVAVLNNAGPIEHGGRTRSSVPSGYAKSSCAYVVGRASNTYEAPSLRALLMDYKDTENTISPAEQACKGWQKPRQSTVASLDRSWRPYNEIRMHATSSTGVCLMANCFHT